MIVWDIEYVRAQSLWPDLKIMFKTIPVVMSEVKSRHSPQAPATPPASR